MLLCYVSNDMCVHICGGVAVLCAGHAVFPSLYASMRNKQQGPKLMVAAFAVVVSLYGAMAIMG